MFKVKGHVSANLINVTLGEAFFCQFQTYQTIQCYHKTACEWFKSNA